MTDRPMLLRLVHRLLARRVPADRAEFLLGDLEEAFHRRRRQSRAGASVWLLREAVACSVQADTRPCPYAPAGSPSRARQPRPVLREAWRALRARLSHHGRCRARDRPEPRDIRRSPRRQRGGAHRPCFLDTASRGPHRRPRPDARDRRRADHRHRRHAARLRSALLRRDLGCDCRWTRCRSRSACPPRTA